MKSLLLPFILILAGLAPLRAELFPGEPVVLTAGDAILVRGVINTLVAPVPDPFELPQPVQSGHFLFSSQPITIRVEDGEEGPYSVLDQTIFHLSVPASLEGRIEGLLEKPVEVRAEVSPAHTRYHRTPVILIVESIRLLAE